MEGNRDEASRCIYLTKFYIKKKDLDNAWKFSVKANKLFPTSETRHLMIKLKSKLKNQKRRLMEKNQSVSDDCDASYNGDHSNSSSSDGLTMQQSLNHPKKSYKSRNTSSNERFKEMNKDESYRCLEKAEQCIKKKDYQMAEKFVLKSKKLFPISKADELFQKLQEIQEESKPKYTQEQANFVKKVKNSKNYYTMLDIKFTATVPEIKKAYKKLALLLHPDKNQAPGSGEAFIVVSNAVDTLSDCEKRKTYDLSIREPSISTSSHTYNNVFYERYEPPYGAHRNPYQFYQPTRYSSDECEYDYVSGNENDYGSGNENDYVSDNLDDYVFDHEDLNNYNDYESFE